MATVRICICGDESVGKTALITALIKDTFMPGRLHPVLPPITLPSNPIHDPSPGGPAHISSVLVDTSSLPQERDALRRELRKAHVILLLYADHYSFERIALFWMPLFRSVGVNVPVVLCASKCDQEDAAGFMPEEMLALMSEFREIDSCIRTSAKDHANVNEAFFLCQKAVTHPIAPLYDAKEADLKPAAVAALTRVFLVCDKDQDGWLSDAEVQALQEKCFGRQLDPEGLEDIKETIRRTAPESAGPKGIDVKGLIILNKEFAVKGRHETIWTILRTFHYTDSLSLHEGFLHPPLTIPPYASAELSPEGYRFFVDLFLLHDKDTDGGLNEAELATLFAPTPGLPPSWLDSAFPSCAVRNEAGHITLQGWLAQWSMTTFEEPRTTLEYLAYLEFSPHNTRASTTAALRITKPRKNRSKPGRVERNVFSCYVLGAAGSGKTSLLDTLLARPFNTSYSPTIKPRSAVNSVELPGGKQCYLILHELGELEPAILENTQKLDACDLLCYVYDSSDPDSFAHIPALQRKYPALEGLPSVYVALKADLDKAMQRHEMQPDEYCTERNMPAPMHVSVRWGSVQELFAHLAECATTPSQAFPKRDEEPEDRMPMYLAGGAAAAAFAAAVVVWKKGMNMP